MNLQERLEAYKHHRDINGGMVKFVGDLIAALEASHRDRETLKQRLDGVYGALADAATVVVSTDNPGESVRSLIAERDRLAADNHRLRLGDMSAMDYERLVEWINNPQRQVSHLAFTAGAARTAAKAIEDSSILSEYDTVCVERSRLAAELAAMREKYEQPKEPSDG